MFYGL